MDIIRVEHLCKSYGQLKAVNDISFRVEEGEFFSFLGLNGAGKSTTISIICGCLSKDSGTIRIDGLDAEKNSDEIKRKLGVVFQNSVLDRPLSVIENLRVKAAMYGITGKDFNDSYKRLSELLDFCARLQRDIGEMPNESEAVTVYEVLDNPERINPQYGEKLENADFSAPLLNNAFSQTVAKYLVFRYFLNAVYDRDVLSRAKLAVLGAFLPSWLGNDAWSVHLWSKETEHSDINMERLRHNLKHAECLSVDSLKEMLKK